MNFLSAKWEYLVMLNYRVPSEILIPYLPPFTELDTFEDHAMISIVGFLFDDTHVIGLKWPNHVNFEEVNLRFYVKHFDGLVWKRGVAFTSEVVPKKLIACIANSLYNEHYSAMPMKHKLHISQEEISIEYQWKSMNKWNLLALKSKTVLNEILPGSQEEFIFEHYFGYCKLNEKVCFEYAVEHPRWQIFSVIDYNFDCDIENLYGKEFIPFINGKPDSVYFARGSSVIVKPPKRIKGIFH